MVCIAYFLPLEVRWGAMSIKDVFVRYLNKLFVPASVADSEAIALIPDDYTIDKITFQIYP